jgi:hypothetical protein
MTAKELESKAWPLIGMAKVADGCTAMCWRSRMPTSKRASHGAIAHGRDFEARKIAEAAA